MANFFTDNDDRRFQFTHLPLDAIIRLRENDFEESREYDHAPENAEDAKDNYMKVLQMAGQICAEFIAPRAAEVDKEGSHFEDGKVTLAKGLEEAMDILAKADLMGLSLPRRFGGLNFPYTVTNIFVEMISQADASLMNLVGLQDIAETINKFASEELKAEFIPKFSSGESTGAMALTEPDAGSDLQAVQLKATEDPETGMWRLNGVKRFITNGCGDIMLVLARSEEGSKDGRGLSMFLYERDFNKKECVIRRIENKLGIKGSPTCELQFNDAPAYLVGKRRMGLIKYVMSLMNGARVGVALQALGIAQAAYEEAHKYANEREQFGKKIIDFPAVYEMLTRMKVDIEAARSLIYATSIIVDLRDGMETRLEASSDMSSTDVKAMREEFKRYDKLAGVLTPLSKYIASEMSIRVSSDAIQIHGGTGYMKEFDVERHYRDARITSIYEGTSQFQVIAAIGGILTGTLTEEITRLRKDNYPAEFSGILKNIDAGIEMLGGAITFVKEQKDTQYTDYVARRIVDMGSDVYISLLLLQQAKISARKKEVSEVYIQTTLPRIQGNAAYIVSGDRCVMTYHRDIIGLDKLN